MDIPRHDERQVPAHGPVQAGPCGLALRFGSRRRGARATTYNGPHGNLHGLALITLVVAVVAGIVVLAWLIRYWSDTNSKDMGTMSAQWVAEQNNSHQ